MQMLTIYNLFTANRMHDNHFDIATSSMSNKSGVSGKSDKDFCDGYYIKTGNLKWNLLSTVVLITKKEIGTY
jgi:hypothetical protein